MRPTWRQPPLVVGHRGAPREAPENTLRAFEQALMQGARAVELDVRVTADAELVVHHDPTLGRVFPGNVRVEASTWAALREARTPEGEPMATLRDVLARLPPDVLLDVEIKADSLRALDAPALVHALVEEHGARDRVLVTSFDGEVASEYARLAGRPAGHILPYAPDEGDLHDWPLLTFVVVAEGALDERCVALLRDAGRRVMAWTVNDAQRARRLVEWGVDALITDRPGWLLGRLRPGASAP